MKKSMYGFFTMTELVIVLIVIAAGWFVWQHYFPKGEKVPISTDAVPDKPSLVVWTPERCQAEPIPCLEKTRADLQAEIELLMELIQESENRLPALQQRIANRQSEFAAEKLALEEGRRVYQQAQSGRIAGPLSVAGQNYPDLPSLKAQLSLWFISRKVHESTLKQMRKESLLSNRSVYLFKGQLDSLHTKIDTIDRRIIAIKAGITSSQTASVAEDVQKLLESLENDKRDVLRDTQEILQDEKRPQIRPDAEDEKAFEQFLKQEQPQPAAPVKPAPAPAAKAPAPVPVVKAPEPVKPVPAPPPPPAAGWQKLHQEMQQIAAMKKGNYEKTPEFQQRQRKAVDALMKKVNTAAEQGQAGYQVGVAVSESYDADSETLQLSVTTDSQLHDLLPALKQLKNKGTVHISPQAAKAQMPFGQPLPVFGNLAWEDGKVFTLYAVFLHRGDQKYGLSAELPVVSFVSFRDCDYCPEMVWLPGTDNFTIGSPKSEKGRDGDEDQKSGIRIERFAMGKYEVTFAEYDRFAEATGRAKPDDKGWGRGNRPVINVSWHDAVAYAEWLSEQTGQTYRLPTEAEWEYAARGGTSTARYWGEEADKACAYANVHDLTSERANKFSWEPHGCDDKYAQTSPVGALKNNVFGLHDVIGNVWEWTCSEYSDSYNGSESKCNNGASRPVLRGGSWYNLPVRARSAFRDGYDPPTRSYGLGFRLARI